jgi:HPt (histidine-containing phosphotransfer) domain-containing protein
VIEELRQKFLPRFVAVAWERLHRAESVVAEKRFHEVPEVVREIHSLAGEAGLLGLGEVLELARAAEAHARRFQKSHGEVEAHVLSGGLKELAGALRRAACDPHLAAAH